MGVLSDALHVAEVAPTTGNPSDTGWGQPLPTSGGLWVVGDVGPEGFACGAAVEYTDVVTDETPSDPNAGQSLLWYGNPGQPGATPLNPSEEFTLGTPASSGNPTGWQGVGVNLGAGLGRQSLDAWANRYNNAREGGSGWIVFAACTTGTPADISKPVPGVYVKWQVDELNDVATSIYVRVIGDNGALLLDWTAICPTAQWNDGTPLNANISPGFIRIRVIDGQVSVQPWARLRYGATSNPNQSVEYFQAVGQPWTWAPPAGKKVPSGSWARAWWGDIQFDSLWHFFGLGFKAVTALPTSNVRPPLHQRRQDALGSAAWGRGRTRQASNRQNAIL